MPIKKALLSDNLKEQFNKLHTCKSFEERTAILQWAIDEMRSDVLEHFEESKVIEGMDEKE